MLGIFQMNFLTPVHSPMQRSIITCNIYFGFLETLQIIEARSTWLLR